MYVVPHRGRSRVNVYARTCKCTVHTCTCIFIVCTIHICTLFMCKLNTLINCLLLHTHTQLLIDPRSSNEKTNCYTSSCAFKDVCVFTGMVLVCVYLWISIYSVRASTLCSLSPTHTLYRDPCSNGLNGHCELFIFMLSWVIYICLGFLE